MDLTVLRVNPRALEGVALWGLAAFDGVGWLNVLDGLPQSDRAVDITLQLVLYMF